MIRKSKGSALAQYGIALALVALGCAAGYILYGKTIQEALNKYLAGQTDLSNQMEANANIASTKTTPAPKAGSLGGTPTNPKEDCINGLCTVDYGDFILNGIPEDFQDFTEAQGTSGGTDKLAAIINQLANQLEEEGNLNEAQELRNFANLLSFMANIESDIVDQVKTCPAESDPGNCYDSNLIGTNVSVPSELTDQGILTSFSTNNLSTDNRLKMLDIGQGVTYYNFDKNNADNYLGSAFYSMYNDIQTSPQYSNAIKNIIKSTYTTAAALSMSTFMQSHDLTFGVKSSYFSSDIFTGEPNTSEYPVPNATFNTIKHPPKAENPTLNLP